jgi:hypothetical protein
MVNKPNREKWKVLAFTEHPAKTTKGNSVLNLLKKEKLRQTAPKGEAEKASS